MISKKSARTRSLQEALEEGVNPRLRLLVAPFLEELVAASGHSEADGEGGAAGMALFLRRRVEEERRGIEELRSRREEFTRSLGRASSQEEAREQILDFARALGADARALRGDARAFDRWFDQEAVLDRYLKRQAEGERRLTFLLDRLGTLAAAALRTGGEEPVTLWRRLDLEKSLEPLLVYEGDHRVCLEAFRSLSKALQALPPALQEASLDPATLSFVYRCALDSRRPIWIQCEALALLASLSADSLRAALARRLGEPRAGDDLFVRRRAVRLLGENLPRLPQLADLVSAAAADPSPFVRQELAAALPALPPEESARLLRRLAADDSSPQVRGAALLGAKNLVRSELFTAVRDCLVRVLTEERDPFVLRVACTVSEETHGELVAAGGEEAELWRSAILPPLERLHCEAEHIPARRWAALAREGIWCMADPDARALLTTLRGELADLPSGRRRRLRRALAQHPRELLGRVLAVMAREEMGYDLSLGPVTATVSRGLVFRFRLWRLLHELRNPSPDKRQAFRHTVGRVGSGQVLAPSPIMAELSETKVPGEPLFLSAEGGWRPYLPLVDDLLSALDQNPWRPTVTIHTVEGVTEITPPRSLGRRLRARLKLTWHFARYARLRNWREGDLSNPSAYLEALAALGIRIRLIPHAPGGGARPETDPAVARFFPAAAPLFLVDLWPRLQQYFFSLYGNTLYDLAVFTAAGVGFFFWGHLRNHYALCRCRRRLPFVVGGWGTRGKSGTERLKAALFNALGYSVFSKTTGCEAMFLHAPPHGELKEMALFRPYDKATIWEQQEVVNLASTLKSDVFLYECMALTPSYVRILRKWMKDDLSTLTNAYPDHEDLQGPAGINIPQVMNEFIPQGGILCTTEEQMLPILAEGARPRRTRVESAGWLQAGLLTPDILQRFSYAEHPYNIALVLRMAEELGIDPDFALKEMADRAVADIGVLKSYPAARIEGRSLEFVNGMSANERFGCLENWRRMGFDRHSLQSDPGVWITTLVNNRADRVARSQVFARMLVRDLAADRHVLIGTNLRGLWGYIQKAWEEHARELTLWPGGRDGEISPAQIVKETARRLRIPCDGSEVAARLRAMLAGVPEIENPEELCALWEDPQELKERLHSPPLRERGEAIARQLQLDLEGWRSVEELAAGAQRASHSDRERVDRKLREVAGGWFLQKFVTVDDSYAGGEEVIYRIVRETPPGVHNRIMGVQNIKGTGLDFVYRWQGWERCHAACAQMRGGDPGLALKGLQSLAGFRDYGLLCEEEVREAVADVRRSILAQREHFQSELAVIESNLQTDLAQVRSGLGEVRRNWVLTPLLRAVEALLDTDDSVRRRRIANQIYRDLADERIGHGRAARELQLLNQRQKGGWLLGRLQILGQRLRRPLPDRAQSKPAGSDPGR